MRQHIVYVYEEETFGAWEERGTNAVAWGTPPETHLLKTDLPSTFVFDDEHQATAWATAMAKKYPGKKFAYGVFSKLFQCAPQPEVSVSNITEKGILPDGF